MSALAEQLRDRDMRTFDQGVRPAVAAGLEGDRELARVLPELPRTRAIIAAAALGDASGGAGVDALARAWREPSASRDLRCAALLALAKREYEGASAELADGLAYPDGVVKGYAMIGLAGFGDDRAWDAALDRLPPAVPDIETWARQDPLFQPLP
jgi:hypothetical protein